MKKKRIVLRADGNLQMGYGHVMRSLALAEILKDHYDCVMAIQNPDEFLKSEISKICSLTIILPHQTKIIKEIDGFADACLKSDDIVVLDGYQFDSDYQKKIRKGIFKLVSIDDIFATHFYSDIVINHTSGIKANKYSVERYTKLFLGLDYLILRTPFLKTRRELHESKIHRAFINLGGTDHKNYTIKALRECLAIPAIHTIDVVIGSLYPFRKEVEALIKKNINKNIVIHTNLPAEEICELMKLSTIGICSASTVAYEYCSVGGVLFMYKVVENQKNLHSFLKKNNIGFSPSDLKNVINKMSGGKFMNRYSDNRKKFFKGNSIENLLTIFKEVEKERGIEVRKAVVEDVDLYYQWVNDIEVRFNSINQETVALEDHRKWFAKKLAEKKSFLYIIEKDKQPMGQVRLEINGEIAEIDYSVDKNFRNKGYGKVILSKAIETFKGKYPGLVIKGIVKETNIPSNRVFLALNFKLKNRKVIEGISYNIFLQK